jgi:hypothetical protein
MKFLDQLSELSATLIGPAGPPGRSRTGPPGPPGAQGPTGLTNLIRGPSVSACVILAFKAWTVSWSQRHYFFYQIEVIIKNVMVSFSQIIKLKKASLSDSERPLL